MYTRDFLRRLLSPYNGGYKKVPKEVREAAYRCLKHYPSDWDIERAKPDPDVFDLSVIEEKFKK